MSDTQLSKKQQILIAYDNNNKQKRKMEPSFNLGSGCEADEDNTYRIVGKTGSFTIINEDDHDITPEPLTNWGEKMRRADVAASIEKKKKDTTEKKKSDISVDEKYRYSEDIWLTLFEKEFPSRCKNKDLVKIFNDQGPNKDKQPFWEVVLEWIEVNQLFRGRYQGRYVNSQILNALFKMSRDPKDAATEALIALLSGDDTKRLYEIYNWYEVESHQRYLLEILFEIYIEEQLKNYKDFWEFYEPVNYLHKKRDPDGDGPSWYYRSEFIKQFLKTAKKRLEKIHKTERRNQVPRKKKRKHTDSDDDEQNKSTKKTKSISHDELWEHVYPNRLSVKCIGCNEKTISKKRKGDKAWQRAHILSKKEGWPYEIWNLMPLCASCNGNSSSHQLINILEYQPKQFKCAVKLLAAANYKCCGPYDKTLYCIFTRLWGNHKNVLRHERLIFDTLSDETLDKSSSEDEDEGNSSNKYKKKETLENSSSDDEGDSSSNKQKKKKTVANSDDDDDSDLSNKHKKKDSFTSNEDEDHSSSKKKETLDNSSSDDEDDNSSNKRSSKRRKIVK
jgi:hypothetical protein